MDTKQNITKKINGMKKQIREVLSKYRGNQGYTMEHAESELLNLFLNKKDDWRDKVTYLTTEQNQLISNKMQLMQEMHQFAHVRNEGWLPDWESGYMDRYGVVRGEYGVIKVRRRISFNDFVFGLAVKSQGIAEEMFEEFGERIAEVYNKQY